MHNRIRNVVMAVAALLFWLAPASAQITVGDNVSLNLAGDLSVGYTGSFGDSFASNHGLSLGGDGRLTGYYYNPNFLSFNLQPYYNRSQSNSEFQSISDSSGVNASVDIFRGSHFPGSVGFSKSYDSSGEFGIPGAAGFTTRGSGQAFSIAWSALLPHLPTLTASFSLNDGNSEIFGATSESRSSSRNFNLQSNYSIAGFRLNGTYLHQSMDARFPAVFVGEPARDSTTGSNSIAIQGSHAIPLNGQWSAGFSHSTYDGEFSSGTSMGTNNGETNTFNTGVSLNPIRRLGLSFNSTYNSNLFGTLQQQILAAGGDLSQRILGSSASALSLNGSAFYSITSHIGLNAQVNHQEQYFLDSSHSITQYGGGINFNYAHRFLGSLSFSVGAVDAATQQGNSGAALVGNVNFSRRIRGWELGSNFSYAQQVQTLVAIYTTSSYGYDASLRRRFRNGVRWTGTFHGSHSGLSRQAGSNNHAEGVSASLAYGRFAANGVYSRSGGVSILTAQGLVAIPTGVPAPLVAEQTLYQARSLGGGASATLKRFVVTVNYSKANSSSLASLQPTLFETKLLSGRLQYRVRKMYLNAGFTKFQQEFGAAGTAPSVMNTYYFGVTRWFNVF